MAWPSSHGVPDVRMYGMKLIVDGIATEYSDMGKGPVLLLLHGWQDTKRTFDDLSKELRGFRLISLDLPGFGGSELPKEDWRLDDYVQLVRDFVTKLRLEPKAIIGHSFGGRIAIKGVAAGVLKANRMVLIDSGGISRSQSLRNVLLKVAAKIGGVITYVPPLIFFRQRLKTWLYKAIGSDYNDAGPLKKTFVNVVSEDLIRYAGKISTPTLIIWGSDDTETPLSDGRQFAQAIKGSKLHIIEGAGHFVHRQQPKQVASAIQEFMQ